MEPTIEYAEDIWKFRQEIIDSSDHDKFAGCGTLEASRTALEWIETTKYGKEMLRQNLINAQKRGIEKVLITCTVNDEVMKRYWITVDRE